MVIRMEHIAGAFRQWVEKGWAWFARKMRCGSAASRRYLQALENHIAVELAAATVGMETLKLAHGDKVTLRGEKMYEFLDRLVNLALPRVRDFRGVSAESFDGRGNYALGIKEQIIFPEIEYDKIDKVRGMDVIIATTAHTDEEARELLRMFNMPFKN